MSICYLKYILVGIFFGLVGIALDIFLGLEFNPYRIPLGMVIFTVLAFLTKMFH